MIGKKGLISTFFVLGSVFGCAQAHAVNRSGFAGGSNS